LAKSAARERDARHYGADGDVEDDSNVFVLNLFYVAEKENFAEGWVKLFESGVESGLVVDATEDALMWLRKKSRTFGELRAGRTSIGCDGWLPTSMIRMYCGSCHRILIPMSACGSRVIR
jgi:hypothetical protein